MRVVIPLSLHSENDADILDWLSQQPERERSAAVRRAVRAYLDQQRITLADVYHAILELQQRTIVAVPEPPVATESPEDREIGKNLDKLLGL
ncbi:MAG: hypothetical protein D6768_01520 [Chloroflexi bacterium]|nr:MAG: hypothetical protein D6768_01520 [Chloroflexota bacterium]